MIDNPFAPSAPKCRISSTREDDGILDRDDRLIVIPVQSPGLKLTTAKSPFVHHQMERMLMVISLFPHRSQRRAQLIERQQCVRLFIYSSNCHPSSAISQPASRTCRCS